MRLLSGFTLAFLAVSLATMAPAQRIGSHIGKDATAADGRDVAQMMADCWVERQPAKASRWMDSVPGASGEYAKVFGDVREFETCLTDDRLIMDDKALRFKPPTMRRTVALALVRGALRRQPAPQRPMAQGSLPWFAGRMPSDGKYDAYALSMQEFGQCIALADWAHSVAMLSAGPDSKPEIEAFRALVPTFGPCVPENEKVSLTRPLVRQVLAEPVYHLMTVASGGKR